MITAHWPTVNLGSCVDLLAGFAFKSEWFTEKVDDIPLVKGENVSQGRILWDISKRWPLSDRDNLEKFLLIPGDVIVAMDRPWVPAGLKWAFIREGDPKALLVQRCARLRANSGLLDQEFLRFVIGSPNFENYVKPITTGVNVPHISGQQILNFEFAIPPLSLQRRIAGILSAYDELIENNQRRIKILEEMVRSLYSEWFVHFRFPGHEKVKMVHSSLGPIPQGWEGRFGALVTIERDGINPFEYPQEPFEHFSIPAFDNGRQPVTERGGTILSGKYYIDSSCVLLSKLNPRISRIWLPIPSGHGRAITSTEFLVLKPRQGATREFIYAKCCSEEFTSQFASLAIGTSTSHQRVKPENLLTIPSTAPDRSIIERFSSVVAPMLLLSQQLRGKIKTLRRTRDLLLPRLLSGQIPLAG